MFKINKLSKKMIVYVTSLILTATLIFTTISMLTLLAFKKYTVNKTEQVLKNNAYKSLERGVVFYAKILERAMRSRKKTVFMFGKIMDKNINSYYKCSKTAYLSDIYEEMNQSFDMRDIEILNSNMKTLCRFPQYIDTAALPKILKHTLSRASELPNRVKYIDFHINKDGSISYSYVYLTKDTNNNLIFIVFDFNPYNVYSLIKTAQFYPYSKRYLWVINKKGLIIFDPSTENHSLITLTDRVNLTNAKNGEVLSDLVKNRILKGGTGVSRYIFRNVDKFVGYTYIKDLGWGLGLTFPTETFYAPIINLGRTIDTKTIYTLSALSIINAFVILLTIIITMMAAKRFTLPITLIINAINDITNGRTKGKLTVEGNDELSELAESVNKLMDFCDNIWTNINKTKGV